MTIMASTSDRKQQFIDKIESLVESDTFFKMTFSKPRYQNKEIINAYLKPVSIKNVLHYQINHRYKTKDQTKNFAKLQIMDVVKNFLGDMFHNAVIFTEDVEITLLQSKKGKARLIIKEIEKPFETDTSHDRQKKRYIPESAPWLQDLGLASQEGKIFDKSQDKYRQINKFIEVMDAFLKDLPQEELITIVDMGCGKGYLTFAMYDYLVNTRKLRCQITGYDIKPDTIALSYNIAIKYGFVGLTFQQKDISDVDLDKIDVVIALHACDIATDIAISKGIKAGAEYIVASPCCHKQVRKAMKHNNVLSPILKQGILEERQAEIITDGIRALLLEGSGYKTQVFEFISTEHTAKKLMITARKDKVNPDAFDQVKAIKEYFGIEFHYLEKLLDEDFQ